MKVFIGLLGFLAFGLFQPAFAASWDATCFSGIPGAEEVATIRCIVPLFTNLVQGLLALSGVALFVMLVVGGFNFLLSGGDPKKLEAARGTLTSAIIGIVVIVVAFLIIKTVQAFTNSSTDVTQFNLNF